jgi:hypothetical protein
MVKIVPYSIPPWRIKHMPASPNKNDTFTTLQRVIPNMGINSPVSYEKVVQLLLKDEKFGVSKLLTAVACYVRDNPTQFTQPAAGEIAEQLEVLVNQYVLSDAP